MSWHSKPPVAARQRSDGEPAGARPCHTGHPPALNSRVQLICIWAMPVGFTLMLVGFAAGSMFPFPSPNHDPQYIGAFYRDHAFGIRLMAALVAVGSAFTAPVAAVLGAHLRRIEGVAPLAYLGIGMGCVSALGICIPAFFWQTAAFRPERDPVVTQSWHDAGWLCFVATVFIGFVQIAATGLAVLVDTHEQPLFPRWLGYLSIWAALLLAPSVLCLWFKTGPFAWNGLLTIYLAFAAAGAWFISVMVVLLKIIAQDEAA